MSQGRYSFWHLLVVVTLVLAVGAAALAGGLYVGYQWGRSAAMANLQHQIPVQQGETPEVAPPMPRSGFPGPFRQRGPYLGVLYETVTPELAEQEDLSVDHGALVREVFPGSPADQAGLLPGDVIVAVDGESVGAELSLRDLVSQHDPGDRVTLEVRRGEERLALQVTLGERHQWRFFGEGEIPFPQDALPRFRFRLDCRPEPCPFFEGEDSAPLG